MSARVRPLHVLLALLLALVAIVVTAPFWVNAHARWAGRGNTRVEAVHNLRKLFDASVAYYHEEHLGPDGAPLPKQFPPSAATSPARLLCADGERYAPRADDWSDATWRALRFAIDDPHRYRYEYVSDGVGPAARFTARAIGDVDCDGVYSTFERTGAIDAEGNVMAGGRWANEGE